MNLCSRLASPKLVLAIPTSEFLRLGRSMGFKVKALVGAVSAVALAAALSSTVMSSAAMAATQALPSLAGPSRAPDGGGIAFASGGDLWTAPAAGGQARLLVTDPATESRPLYSPDGKSLAFVSTRSGVANIYILTLATGVHYSCFFEHRQQLRGLRQSLACRLAGPFPHCNRAKFPVSRRFPCPFCGLLNHRKYGPLHRFGHGLIRGIGGVLQRPRHLRAAECVQTGKALGPSVEELRQNDTTVTPSTHEGPLGYGRGKHAGTGAIQPWHLFIHSFKSKEHIGAGVTVGDREDVEGIDRSDVHLQR